MNELTISCPAQAIPAYQIIWSEDFSGIADAVRSAGLHPARICIVTDDVVASFCLDPLASSLGALGAELIRYTFAAGEEQKHLGTVEAIYRFLAENGLDRGDLLVALGGGVVGDMTGFAAATYLRGISFIQVPTTLLAMVDSSIGGKTGVDLTGLKNMVGAFHQPRLVYMVPQTLQSLPAEQFACGMAEVIKTALIRDAAFFDWLSEHRDNILAKDAEALLHMIRRCCEIKADVVREDPTERGVRAILNFGHTIGHAVEKCSDFTMLHGQSVAVGTAAALEICELRGLLGRSDVTRAKSLLAAFELPLSVTGYDPEQLLATTKSDKKMRAGRIRFILLDQIGSAVICDDLSDEELLRAAESICADCDTAEGTR